MGLKMWQYERLLKDVREEWDAQCKGRDEPFMQVSVEAMAHLVCSISRIVELAEAPDALDGDEAEELCDWLAFHREALEKDGWCVPHGKR
jgi:hypothetical protein